MSLAPALACIRVLFESRGTNISHAGARAGSFIKALGVFFATVSFRRVAFAAAGWKSCPMFALRTVAVG